MGLRLLLAVLILLAAGELFARYGLGLGTPPVYEPDARMEYRLQPNQDLRRFGRRFVTNELGLRSDPLTTPKPADARRVLVMGDSVVNGGSLIDHADLATTLLQQRGMGSGRMEVVNVSAGSWGPGNWLAFARDPGLLAADALVLVVSSHDYADNPSFAPLDPSTQPMRRPVSALAEGVLTYLPRYLPIGQGSESSTPALDGASEQNVTRAMGDLEALLQHARRSVPLVIVLQHLDRRELPPSRPAAGYWRIRSVCAAAGVSVRSLGPALAKALTAGVDPYRDTIHLNKSGQALLASVVASALAEAATVVPAVAATAPPEA